MSSFLSCAVSDTAIATGTAAEFTNSSTDGAGLVVSSSLGASTDGFVSVGASEPLFTVVFSDLAVSELASDVTVLSTFLPAWLVTGSTGVASGEILSKDALGVTGDQVWTFAKSGKGFSTVQMINMMGINAG